MMTLRSSPQNTLAFLFILCATTFCEASVELSPKDTMRSVLTSAEGISWGRGLVAVGAIGVGAMICGAGYRLFRLAIFVSGFIVGGLFVAGVLEYLFKTRSWIGSASWIGFIVGGLVVGMFAMSMYTTSIFIAGAAAGVLLAFTLHTTFTYKISVNHLNVVLIISAILLGLLCGWLALKLEKPALVIATSMIGAIMMTWGIGYFTGSFPSATDLKRYENRNINGDMLITIPTAWWGYLISIITLFAFGVLIQFGKTGRNGNYHSMGKNQHYLSAQTPMALV